MKKFLLYLDYAIINGNEILVRPSGMNDADFIALINTSELVKSGKFTKTGKEYINFAPKVVEANIKYIKLKELGL